MQPVSLNEIREKFLVFFEEKDHLRLPSFSLVPQNDPSILLINAGMTPLKPFFTGAQTPPAARVTTCQKCIRTPDIERVGLTSRHGTFFEMLGNFSFGDYFKAEIIPWSWTFCTEVLQMPEEKLYISIYETDDEAFQIWHEKVGLPADRIVRLGKEDNFWEHGVGPCGPSSEIYFDRGADKGCGSAECQVGCDCDRFVEFWNLVFTQYNKEADGSYTPLDRKNIDTGAGLERLACIMQNVDSLFEVDTIRSVLDTVCKIAGVTYGHDDKTDVAVRVITDHIRSTTMMVSDGIIPSNEGRGYVLRRLLRRASRYGRLLGVTTPFLTDVAQIVIRESARAYPELSERRDYLLKIIKIEEERFNETVQQGMVMLEHLIEQAKQEKHTRLDGQDAFRLHDTYGFPLDLTREIAAEQGLSIDEQGFSTAMNQQQNQARQALRERSGSAWGHSALPEEVDRAKSTEFNGYDTLEDKSVVLYLIESRQDRKPVLVESAAAGSIISLITEKTPFYAESGGQAGDTGRIISDQASLSVQNTIQTGEGLTIHQAIVESGDLRIGDPVRLLVDGQRRLATARNHTTTHILHKALRIVLGDHVAQAGSAVSPDRLRFDFSHFQPLSDDEKQQIENLVNQVILANHPVKTRIMGIEQARQDGAVALFDEKYGDQVRVVSVGDFSRELCGGTHLRQSSEACLFRIVSENGVAAGVRRIEGVTGTAAWSMVQAQSASLQQAGKLMKAASEELPRRLESLLEQNRQLEKRLEAEQLKQARSAADQLAAEAERIDGISLVMAELEVADAQQLREAADHIRDKTEPAIILLAADVQGKALWVAMVSQSAIDRGFHAGNLIREAARLTGGGGGGRPDMAQAGGKKPDQISAALAEVRKIVYEHLK